MENNFQINQLGINPLNTLQIGVNPFNIGGNFTSTPQPTIPARPFNPFSINTFPSQSDNAQSNFLVPTSNVTEIGKQPIPTLQSVSQFIPQQNQTSFDPYRNQNIDESQLRAQTPQSLAANPLRFIPGMPQTLDVSTQLPFVGDALKAAIETPERFFSSLAQIPQIARGGFNPSTVPEKKSGNVAPDTYFQTLLNAQRAYSDMGYDDKTATLASFLGTASSVILDAVFVGGLLESAAKSVLVGIPATPKEVQVAYDFLGKPTTLQEAENTYRALQRQFHPEMPTGDARISAQLNNAIEVLRESGIPGQQGAISQGIRKTAETLLKPISELGKTAGGTPFAGIKGLLPEQTGFRPTEPFQPIQQPAFGLSLRDINLTKETIGSELTSLTKAAQGAGSYEKFLSDIADNLLIQPEKLAALKEAGFTPRTFYNQAVTKGVSETTATEAKTPEEVSSTLKSLISETSTNSLIQEARKYKSAEEFVNKVNKEVPISRDRFGNTSLIKTQDNLPPLEPNLIRLYRAEGGTRNFNTALKKTNISELPEKFVEGDSRFYTPSLADADFYAKEYGAKIKYIDVPESITQKINPAEYLITKSQLTDIWNKAKGISSATSKETKELSKASGKQFEEAQPAVRSDIPEFIQKKLDTMNLPGSSGQSPTTPPGGNENLAQQELDKLLNGENRPGFFRMIADKINKFLAPIKTIDKESQNLFNDWKTNVLKAHQLANQEGFKLYNIPESEGWNTITKYQAGIKTPYTNKIKELFDDAYLEANQRGLDNLHYVPNYLPQVYDNTLEEIRVAMARYMEDLGVPTKDIVDFLEKNSALLQDPAAGLKTIASFSKARFIPDYETAMKYGLTPKYIQPSQLLAFWRDQLETTIVNKQFLTQLSESGKLLPIGMNPPNWKEVNIPFSRLRVYAEPNLANMLNNVFADPAMAGLPGSITRTFAGLSRKAQELALSAGIPNTTVNFYAMIQALKQMTAGNLKAIVPFVRANFNKLSAEFFIKKYPTMMRMAENGLDLGNTIADWQRLYDNTLKSRSVTEFLGDEFDKLFNEKTFNSLMPQIHIGIFEDAERKFLKQGLDPKIASAMAADTVRASEGLTPNLGRSQLTHDTLTAIFFAPKFREGIIRTTANLFRGITTDFNNPAFYMNRRLLAGLAITYAMMNLANKKLSGHYMWDNPESHEFDLQYTVDKDTITQYGLDKYGIKEGDIIYIPWFPGFTSTIRNVSYGIKDVLTGDFNRGQRELGSVFSISSRLIWEILGNRNYFGKPIYNDNDSIAVKAKKIALYTHLQVDHPFLQAITQVMSGKQPLYQAISQSLELPFKFSSTDKVSSQEFYNAVDRVAAQRKEERNQLMPIYNQIQDLIRQGKDGEALDMVNKLTDAQYETYKDIIANDKRGQTISTKSKIYDEYMKIQDLRLQGRIDEAQAMLDSLTEEEYRAYQSLAKRFNNE